MAIINVIAGDGSSEEVEIFTAGCVLVVTDEDGQRTLYEAAITEDILLEEDGEESNVTDQCGRTESRRRGSNNFKFVVEGIVTNDFSQQRVERGNEILNLTVPNLKDLRNAPKLELRSDIHNGEVYVKNFSVRQTNDMVAIDRGSGPEPAFAFQLQLKEPEP